MPKRIQRKRTKGWQIPPNTVYVGRPSVFGNPFPINELQDAQTVVERYKRLIEGIYPESVMEFTRARLLHNLPRLTGKDVACWCPLDRPCHGDVLSEIANAPSTSLKDLAMADCKERGDD